MRRVRYKFGSLQVVKGAKQDVWTFRFYQRGADGKREYRRVHVGTTEQYPTETAADRAELGKIGWHSLRHSFATALDVAGARMKVAQELMCHSSITTTMDIYTRTAERDKRETAGRVATAVLGRIQ